MDLTGAAVTVSSSGALDLGDVEATGDLSITTTGAVTDSGTIDVTGKASINAGSGSIVLNSPNSTYADLISLVGSNVEIKNVDVGGTKLKTVTASGTLNVTSTAGDIVDDASGKLTVTGTAILDATTSNDINLTASNGSAYGTLVLTGKAVSVTDAGAVDIGTTHAAGDLTITAGGAITDSGVITADAKSTFTATNFSITLNSASTFVDLVSMVGRDITLTGVVGALDFGVVTATGTFAVSASGDVSNTGGDAIAVTGNVSIDVGTNDIALTNTTFGGTVIMIGGTVSYA